MMNSAENIRHEIAERGVRTVLHFTQYANLSEIVRQGLRSRSDLERDDNPYLASADCRLDENDDAISVSITRLNGSMFCKKRKDSGHNDWVVIGLAPEILWTLRCRFCWTNAAKKEITGHAGYRGGYFAFQKMFTGERLELPPNCPTDDRAEVQVLDPIPPEWIIGAVVEREAMLEPVQQILDRLSGERRPVVRDQGWMSCTSP